MTAPPAVRRALTALFSAQFVLLAALLLGAHALGRQPLGAVAAVAAVQSVALTWLLARAAASRPRVRVAVALLVAAVAVAQITFFRYYGYLLDRHVLACALRDVHDVAPNVRPLLPRLVAITIAVAAVEHLWLRAAMATSRATSRPASRAALALAAAAVLAPLPFVPLQEGPPDLRLLDGIVALARRPAPRPALAPAPVPNLHTSAAVVPNIVLVVTESVRADAYCSAYSPACEASPAVNALFPDRVALPELRSLASFTAPSMAALVTGRHQVLSRDELFRTPTLFDYAKALDGGRRAPFTAFWSAHYAPVFHWADPKRSIDSYVTIENLLGDDDDSGDADVRLGAYFRAHLPGLPTPFLVLLHFYNTHLPYSFDDDDAPFQPWGRTASWSTLPPLFNAYRNAIHRQDRIVAEALRALADDPRFASTVVVFLSDHGEEFGEHRQIHHGQDIFDEQIHVPGFITHGSAAQLRPDQARALRDNATAPLTHLDILPTLLDLYEVLDTFEMAAYRKDLAGRSLLRPFPGPPAPVPLTNCSEEFECTMPCWGMLQGDHKLQAQTWDPRWNCWHLAGGRETSLPPDDPACRALADASRAYFPTLPCGAPNVAP